MVPYNRVRTASGQILATVEIDPITEPIDSDGVPDAPDPKLTALRHVNEVFMRKDRRRIKEIARYRYQIAAEKKALEEADEQLEKELRALLIGNDVENEPLRYDFLRIEMTSGGGYKLVNKELLQAAGIALDVIDQCSKPVKRWEKAMVSNGVKSRRGPGHNVIEGTDNTIEITKEKEKEKENDDA